MAEVLGVAILEVRADISDVTKKLEEVRTVSDSSLRSTGAALMRVGSSITENVSKPTYNALEGAVKLAIGWESSFADVRKTTKGTGEELDKLGRDLLELSTTIPVSTEALTSIASLGSQFGIQREELIKFTDTVARLATATDMSAEKAAKSLAQFVTITSQVAPSGQTASEQIGRMGNVLVALGNNSKTTESAIMNFAARIASTGSAMGMSQQEIMGWAAGLSSLGISAERGGTAISGAFQKMSKAVAEGGASLEAFARVAGMSGEAFASMFKSDPTSAMLEFTEGLKKISDEGGNVYGTLAEVGIGSSAMVDTLMRVAGNTGEVSRVLGVANQGYKENNALINESNERYGTMESRLIMAKNSINAAGIAIGQALLPVLSQLLTSLVPIVHRFSEFSLANPAIVNIGIAFAALLVVVGPLTSVLGIVLSVAGSIATTFAFLSPIVASAGATIGAAIGAISLPVVAVIAVIAALAVAWYNNWFDIQGYAIAAWTFLSSAFNTGKEALVTAIESMWVTITTNFNTNAALIQATVTMLWDSIKAVWNTAIELTKTVTNTFFESLKTAWNALKLAVETLVTALWTAIKTTWSTACEAIKTTMTGFSTAISTAWNTLKTTVETIVTAFATAIKTAYTALTTAISTATTSFSSSFVTAWENLKANTVTTWDSMKSSVEEKADSMYETLKTKTSSFKESTISTVTSLKDNFVSLVNGIKDGAVSAISGMVDTIMGLLNGLVGSAGAAGAGMAQAFGDGIRSALGAALDAARAMAQALRDLLPGSDAKRGPLSDLTASGAALPVTFAKGVDMSSPTLTRSVTGMVSKSVSNNVTINNPVGRTARQSILGALQNMEFAI